MDTEAEFNLGDFCNSCRAPYLFPKPYLKMQNAARASKEFLFFKAEYHSDGEITLMSVKYRLYFQFQRDRNDGFQT